MWKRCGLPNHKVRGNLPLLLLRQWVIRLDTCSKRLNSSRCELLARHLHRGERRQHELRKVDVVKAHNGDIVVALIESSDATLKRFYREGDNIRLQPSNVNMRPIIVPAAAVAVQGRVIGVLRKY